MFGDDGLGWTNVSKVTAGAGGALLDGRLGLPLLFRAGVAVGMAKRSDGSTALAAVAGFLVCFSVSRQSPEDCALLVIGLHQFLNVPVRFRFGTYAKPDGTEVGAGPGARGGARGGGRGRHQGVVLRLQN